MKKWVLFALIFIGSLAYTASFAQSKSEFIKVDYDAIEKFVKNHETEFEGLMKRFIEGDQSLTQDEVKTVYYGSYFSSNYDYADVSKELSEAFNADDYEKSLELCRAELSKSPTNMSLLFRGLVSAKEMEEDNEYEIYRTRLMQILDVVMNTGDGRSAKTAYKIIEVSDEYFIIYGVFGLNFKQQVLSGNYDIMTVYSDEEPEQLIDLYFDITLHMAKLDEIFGFSTPQKAQKGKKKSRKNKVDAKLIIN